MSRVAAGTVRLFPNWAAKPLAAARPNMCRGDRARRMREGKPMNAIFFVLATGIVALTIVELLEYRRRYQMRKKHHISAR